MGKLGRTVAPIEVNKFSGGLLTDSSPLTSQDGFSLDEVNMVLNIDGSRNRRFGMDLENGYENIPSSFSYNPNLDLAISSFKWKNVGGDATKTFLVVQVGNVLDIFDLNVEPLSSAKLFTYTLTGSSTTNLYSFCVIDGVLVVATGDKELRYFRYEEDELATDTYILYIRDFFGVEDVVDTVDLFSGNGLQTRPTTHTDAHVYNLRNQSFGIPRIDGGGGVGDPINAMRAQSGNKFPSNSDSVAYALYADPNNAGNRTVERFFAYDLVTNPLGYSRAASGYFIIDALERGVSRKAVEAANRVTYPALGWGITSLPLDKTPGGPSVLTEWAGRVWYSGFQGTVEGGDELSPRMSSFVLFSQIVNGIADAGACYQSGDPTAKENADIVDTDGGYIRINGAYGIKSLINLGASLMIIAENGVWRIVGGTDNGFTATQFIVEKVTERGCNNANSIVMVDSSVIFWGEDGIYMLAPDQFGSWQAQGISFGRIQNWFNQISERDRQNVIGEYDNYERKTRWLVGGGLYNDTEVTELVLDMSLKGFYLNKIKQFDGENTPRPVGIFAGNAYRVGITDDPVFVNTDPVLIGTDPVTIDASGVITDTAQRELIYLVINGTEPISYTFGSYRDSGWRDWRSVDGSGIDANAYLVTNFISGGDFQRKKKMSYMTTYLKKTEVGFDENEEGDFLPIGTSSCVVQTMWEWTNSAAAGRWGRPFQAYRHRRFWMPEDVDDLFNDGQAVVLTKNKIRGGGRVLSIKFSTEADKDFHLYGWSMMISAEANV